MTTRRRRGPRPALLVGLLVAVSALAACTGVPASSDPESIQSIAPGNQPPAGVTPKPGEPARQIMTDFLKDNSVDPRQHTAARLYLTTAARNRWTDTTATIIEDERVGTYHPRKSQVVVTGRIVGTLNSDGIYTPTNLGIGGGGQEVAFVYGIAKVNGEYRIDNPHKGLLLTTDQFSQSYQRHPLYFFDLANRYLVPDLRWSALQGTPLEQWLVGELANGPSPALQNAVNSDTMPAQANTRYFNVSSTAPTRVEIPGASQLEGEARNRLAAQVGTTLNDVLPGETFIITDNGRPVPIAAAGGVEFASTSFTATQGPQPPSIHVYYLRGGRVVNENGSLLNGPVNNGSNYLTSVALAQRQPNTLSVAAVAGGRLLVGTQNRGLVPTRVHGELTRPAWAPGQPEVWVGDGDKLYRVVVSGSRPRAFPVQLPPDGGRIVALRLSAEGTRLAIVIETTSGVRRLFLGAIVRSGGKVRVDTLTQVSPAGVSIDDVAWIEPLSLYAIGEFRGSGEPHVFTMNVDGSSLHYSNINALPGPPKYVTVTTGQLAWVSVGASLNATVWEQSGGSSWLSPDRTGQTPGSAPIYLE